MSKKHTAKGMVKRVLLYSAPFLLISAGIFLAVWWGVETFVEGNIVYRVMTMVPEKNEDGNLLVLDEKEKEALVENNKVGFEIPAEFPVITIGEEFAKITIESAGVWQIPVYHGDNDDNLWRGIGHYANSRFPGQNGKVVLSGHVGIYEFFQRLENMQVGDKVTLETTYGKYEYIVTETVIFNENDPSLLLPEAEDNGERLICYTCYPYHTTSVRTQRFAIICEPISGKNWITGEEMTPADSGTPTEPAETEIPETEVIG